MCLVAGIDLSLTSTGMALIGPGGTMVTTVKSAGRERATICDREVRIGHLTSEVVNAVRGFDLVVIEQPAYSRITGHHHDRSGLWWLIVHKLRRLDIPVAEVAPTGRCRYATGKGNASKDAVLAATIRRYLNVNVTGNDEADALILAAMGARHLGHPIDEPPKTHLAAMDAIVWPESLAA